MKLLEYQRVWKEHHVDKNLKDEWLETLNSMKNLKLISICEGHINIKKQLSNPHINMQIKSSKSICKKGDLNINLLKQLIKNVNSNTESEINLKAEYSSFGEYNERIILHFDCIYVNDLENKKKVDLWWDEIIDEIKSIDKKIDFLASGGNKKRIKVL